MPTRNNTLLTKRGVPKKVKLPNGTILYVKHKIVKSTNLPPKVRIARTYNWMIGPPTRQRRPRRRVQAERGMVTLLIKNVLGLGSKAISSLFGKKLAEEGINYTSKLYEPGVKRIWKVLELDLANYAVNQVRKQIYSWQNA